LVWQFAKKEGILSGFSNPQCCKMARSAIVAAAFLGTASAFLPPSFSGKAVTSVRNGAVAKMSAEDLIGTTGIGFFDPLGFSADESQLFKYRSVELKHGRVAMLAVLGVFVQHYTHLPDAVFSNPKPLGALLQLWNDRPIALLQIFAYVGYLELGVFAQDEDKAPGEIGRFGEAYKPDTVDELEVLQLKELKNGRLAMVAIIGMLIQEIVTGQGPLDLIEAGTLNPFGDGKGFF